MVSVQSLLKTLTKQKNTTKENEMSYIGGNSQVKRDPIWVSAARNNKKPVERICRVNGTRVNRMEFEAVKRKYRNWSELFRPFYLLLSC